MNFKSFLLIIFAFINSPVLLHASINDYIYPKRNPSYSNYGTVGLIQMPSARFQNEGAVGFSWSNHDPYLRGSIIAYPFDWMEAVYSYTDINNALYSNVKSFSGNQSYKDKGFDLKLRVLKESQFMPNVAIGLRDLAGSNNFEAEYIVASKLVGNLDFTFGIGWGDLSHGGYKNPFTSIFSSLNTRDLTQDGQGGELTSDRYFSGNIGFFAGAEIFLPNTNGLRLKIEYDSTNYLDEAFARGREASNFAFERSKDADSRINLGLTYPLTKNFQLQGAYTKGNTVNFGFSYVLDFSKKDSIVKKNDFPVKVSDSKEKKLLNSQKNITFYRSILNELSERDLYLQKADLSDSTITVQFAQSRFPSHTLAAGRVARVLSEISPDTIDTFTIRNNNAGLTLYSMDIPRDYFEKYQETKNFKLVERRIEVDSVNSEDQKYKYNPFAPYPAHFYYISPQLRSQIGGPDGFFFGDLRIGLESELQFSPTTSLLTSASIGVYNNFDTLSLASDSILPHVRTDIVKYLKGTEDFQLSRIQFNSFFKPSKDTFLKFSAGILEDMFAGFGSEFLFKPFHRNVAIGAELWRVQQRGYSDPFSFLDYKTTTGHINLYLREPRTQILFQLRGGKFLARDSGINFDFSRRFNSGFSVGAFFSVTDISKREFGEGSFDKGFYFSIPLDIFTSKYVKRDIPWGLRPLTRDGAAFLYHGFPLYGITEQADSHSLMRDMEDIYE